MSHTIKPGVATGKTVQEIFQLAKAKQFALPAWIFHLLEVPWEV